MLPVIVGFCPVIVGVLARHRRGRCPSSPGRRRRATAAARSSPTTVRYNKQRLTSGTGITRFLARADLSEQLAGAEQVPLKRRGRGLSPSVFLAQPTGKLMKSSRRGFVSLSGAVLLGSFFIPNTARAQVKEIRLDFATYNPVSLVLKEKGLLEKAFEKDGIAIRWVQTLGSNKALEFLNAGSIDFGSTAG
jgi:hypothetical protein